MTSKHFTELISRFSISISGKVSLYSHVMFLTVDKIKYSAQEARIPLYLEMPGMLFIMY